MEPGRPEFAFSVRLPPARATRSASSRNPMPFFRFPAKHVRRDPDAVVVFYGQRRPGHLPQRHTLSLGRVGA